MMITNFAFVTLGLVLGVLTSISIRPALTGMRTSRGSRSLVWTLAFGALMLAPLLATRFLQNLPYLGEPIQQHPALFVLTWLTPVAFCIVMEVFGKARLVLRRRKK